MRALETLVDLEKPTPGTGHVVSVSPSFVGRFQPSHHEHAHISQQSAKECLRAGAVLAGEHAPNSRPLTSSATHLRVWTSSRAYLTPSPRETKPSSPRGEDYIRPT